MTVSQLTEQQDPEGAKQETAIFHFIIHTSAFHTVTCQNVLSVKGLYRVQKVHGIERNPLNPLKLPKD